MSLQTNRGVLGTIVLIVLGFAVVAGAAIFVSNNDSEVANEDEKAVEVKDEGDKTMPIKEAEKEKVVGLQFCPDEWIDNQMPTTIELGSEMPTRRDYYRADGVRREISEFDENWVKENCDLERQIVY